MTARSNKNPTAFMVAGTHSGVGKTTVTLTLLRAVLAGGVSVQPFKVGPDFIDTAYHREIAGRPSVNLDLWMMGPESVQSAFDRFSANADVAIIEAMGALYDGEDGTERGSAAYIAKLLDVPIVLVIDIWGMTRSAIPLLQGFMSFDPDLRFAGFIMNRAGSVRHADMVLEALPPDLRKMSLGYILHRDSLSIPERHLGLITPDENAAGGKQRLASLDAARSGLDIGGLLPTHRVALSRPMEPEPPVSRRVRIAIARDQAFTFYYLENIALLEEAGAELCPFSPISDSSLPDDIAGVYIGGGYPESFAEELASNAAVTRQLKMLADRGMPMYAECGGFMYLGRTLERPAELKQPMVGVFPLDTIMDPEHLAIRYVSVRTLSESPLGPAGTLARGQEFHQSRIVGGSTEPSLYEVSSSSGEVFREGMLRDGAMGSYIHLHFASNLDIPRNFVDSCNLWLRRQAS